MAIEAIFAQVACTDLDASRGWYEALFGRAADAAPMKGLLEWHREGAGCQLFERPDAAGRTTLTLIVSDIASERARLLEAGLAAGQVEGGDATSLVRLKDPDGNLVVLAEPR